MKKIKLITPILLFALLTGCAVGHFDPPCACYNPQPANQNIKEIING